MEILINFLPPNRSPDGDNKISAKRKKTNPHKQRKGLEIEK
jgi:hypothetical protein